MIPFRGVRLENPLGANLCFVNVCVNVLLNVRHIRSLIPSDQVLTLLQNFLKNASILQSAKDLRQLLATKFQNFANTDMHDSSEALECLIESSEELKKAFKFILKTVFECAQCGTKSSTEESWICLKLYNLQGKSIQELLESNLGKVSTTKKLCGNKKCTSNKEGGGKHNRTESIIQGKDCSN